MKKKASIDSSIGLSDREARDTSDIRPMTAAMRRQWEAAKETGVPHSSRRGRPPKQPELKSRIVPISIEPGLLAEADQYAKLAGLSRSALIAEALKARLKAS